MITLLILVMTLLVILVKSIKIIRSHEKAVLVRLGKYLMTMEHGLYFVIPFVDKVIKVVEELGRILICCEAVIGAFLIALFVVVLTTS